MISSQGEGMASLNDAAWTMRAKLDELAHGLCEMAKTESSDAREQLRVKLAHEIDVIRGQIDRVSFGFFDEVTTSIRKNTLVKLLGAFGVGYISAKVVGRLRA